MLKFISLGLGLSWLDSFFLILTKLRENHSKVCINYNICINRGQNHFLQCQWCLGHINKELTKHGLHGICSSQNMVSRKHALCYCVSYQLSAIISTICSPILYNTVLTEEQSFSWIWWTQNEAVFSVFILLFSLFVRKMFGLV